MTEHLQKSSTEDTVLQCLRALRTLIGKEHYWCKGNYARTALGCGTSAINTDACQWCLIGGMSKVTRVIYLYYGLRDALVAQLEGYSPRITPDSALIGFNDHSTHAEVIALIDAAIAARTP